jgi:hypothetical protein
VERVRRRIGGEVTETAQDRLGTTQNVCSILLTPIDLLADPGHGGARIPRRQGRLVRGNSDEHSRATFSLRRGTPVDARRSSGRIPLGTAAAGATDGSRCEQDNHENTSS